MYVTVPITWLFIYILLARSYALVLGFKSDFSIASSLERSAKLLSNLTVACFDSK